MSIITLELADLKKVLFQKLVSRENLVLLCTLKFTIGKNNNTRTVQAESSKFASLLFDQGFQIVIPPRIVANVPEPIGMPSDSILHLSDCCLFWQFNRDDDVLVLSKLENAVQLSCSKFC